ncbi:hypothetical protein BG005_010025 [Podila minutissima]|nr:hypothetical protein BG005_010025 [Podila minutissima]
MDTREPQELSTSDRILKLESLTLKLVQDNRHVTVWSFLKADLRPELCQQLVHIQNTITSVEVVSLARPGIDICVKRKAPWNAPFSEMGLARSGLHTFLCYAPLLLHLKAEQFLRSAESLDLWFPESSLHSFEHTSDAVRRDSSISTVSSTTTNAVPPVWACGICRHWSSVSPYPTAAMTGSSVHRSRASCLGTCRGYARN